MARLPLTKGKKLSKVTTKSPAKSRILKSKSPAKVGKTNLKAPTQKASKKRSRKVLDDEENDEEDLDQIEGLTERDLMTLNNLDKDGEDEDSDDEALRRALDEMDEGGEEVCKS